MWVKVVLSVVLRLNSALTRSLVNNDPKVLQKYCNLQ